MLLFAAIFFCLVTGSFAAPFHLINGVFPVAPLYSSIWYPGTGPRDVTRENITCPSPDGKVKDPVDCQRYYHCHAGHPFLHPTCPPGTAFSEQLGICHYASLVGCDQYQDQDYQYDELAEVGAI